MPLQDPSLSESKDFVPSALIVFLISRRCNLQCSYCNVEAGPHVTSPQLTLEQVDEWVRAFCAIGKVNLSVQLHGGEPLLANPNVEAYAAVVRNAVASFDGARLVDIGIQTNGLLLNEQRIASLKRSDVRVNVSIDGPADAHNRFRVTAAGKPSFRPAMKAAKMLLDAQEKVSVISVISDPDDVMAAVDFFVEEGFSGASMNPVRPEGRGQLLGVKKQAEFMVRMAGAYIAAAKSISDVNQNCVELPFYETNIAMTMQSVMQDAAGEPPQKQGWAFMVDDTGTLWAHPGGYGVPSLRLVGPDEDKGQALIKALTPTESATAKSTEVTFSEGMVMVRDALFTPCEGCHTPENCRSHVGHSTERPHGRDPLCDFRTTLYAELEKWYASDPDAARRVTPGKHGTGDPTAKPTVQAETPTLGTSFASLTSREPILPFVKQVLQDIRETGGGKHYIQNFPSWVTTVNRLSPMVDLKTFIQLAIVADQMRASGSSTLYRSLSALAHIGLDPVDLGA